MKTILLQVKRSSNVPDKNVKDTAQKLIDNLKSQTVQPTPLPPPLSTKVSDTSESKNSITKAPKSSGNGG